MSDASTTPPVPGVFGKAIEFLETRRTFAIIGIICIGFFTCVMPLCCGGVIALRMRGNGQQSALNPFTSGVAGKYVSDEKPSVYLELKHDGTFYRGTDLRGELGKYEVEGNSITFKEDREQVAFKGKLDGDTILLPEKHGFHKEGSASLEKAVAAKKLVRVIRVNNLKKIAMGVHGYHDANKVLPHAGDDIGRRKLSWRVEILPYIDQNKLYKQFDFSQSWDHPTNKNLIPQMPA